MEVNIDPEIVPQIESQSGIFAKYSINSDYNAPTHQHDNDQNDFIQQEGPNTYTSFTLHGQDSQQSADSAASAASTAAAAVAAAENLSNIINFNQLQTDRTVSGPHPNSHQNVNTNDSLSFLHNALDLDHSGSTLGTAIAPNGSLQTSVPKQKLIHDSGSQVSIVVVNPGSTEGSSRLGRPRKHTSSNTANAQSSTKNLDESIVSTFRLDSRPIGGPGSRGGRKNRSKALRVQSKTLDAQNGKRKVQKQLNFSVSKRPTIETVQEENNTNGIGTQHLTDGVIIINEDSSNEKEALKPNSSSKEQPLAPSGNTIIFEDYESLKAKGRSTVNDAAKKHLLKISLKSLASNKSLKKKKSLLSGPVVGLDNSPYETEDPNLPAGEDFKKIALGYQVKPAKYAKDIVLILSFFNKFKYLFGDYINLGPQDIETGLKLNTSVEFPLDNVNQSTAESSLPSDQAPEISELMNQFFYKLLSLVLNKKKEITRSTLPKSLVELKSNVLSFGLPSEWRDDSEIFNPIDTPEILNEPEEPVDPKHDEYLFFSSAQFGVSKPLEHTPLDNDDFETHGLESLIPDDRLILIRSLVQWSLSYSEAVKKELQSKVSKQDPLGEKETYYTSRFIKDGEKSLETANRWAKNLPKKKGKKSEPSDSQPNAYNDAFFDPLQNHLSFRLVDFFAGECGINGRFYLVRSASSKAGGYGSVSDLKSLDNKSIHDLLSIEQPSRFKLYVQDLKTTLLTASAIESNQDPNLLNQEIDPWYEIAENTEELKEFLNFLESKLENNKYKRLTNMIEYLTLLLPALEKFENIYKDYGPLSTTRNTRRRQITDLKEQDRALKQLIDDDDDDDDDEYSNKQQIENEFDEGDYWEDGEGDKGDEEFNYDSDAEGDDDDDDDDYGE